MASIPDAATLVAAAAAITELEPVLGAVEPFELLEPVVEEPAAAEPVAVEPVVSGHRVSGPGVPEPRVSKPVAAEPVVEPVAVFEQVDDASAAAHVDAEPVAPAAGSTARNRTRTPQPEASAVDEFELAARLFSFTGEQPVQSSGPAAEGVTAEDEAAIDADGAAAPRERRTRHGVRQLATASFSVGVMGIVGLLAVGMTTPAAAVATSNDDILAPAVTTAGDVEVSDDIQAYIAPATIENAGIVRDESYSTVSMGEIAAEMGITNHSDFFVNDPNAAIQWPFAVGVPITFGFGQRGGEFHEGADFVPGQGADIQSIAAGTVRTATNSGGGYGTEVIVDHIIDGKLVSSRYAHMLYGSIQVKEGQHVEAGTILGHTGNTGHSFGAHTHFEILIGGDTAVDPIAWLRANAGRSSLG